MKRISNPQQEESNWSATARRLRLRSARAWSAVLRQPVGSVRATPWWKPGFWSDRWLIKFKDGGSLVVRRKLTNRLEARVYSRLGGQLPLQIPRAVYTEEHGSEGLCILEELPVGKPQAGWTREDAVAVLGDLARLHAAFWPGGPQCAPDWLPDLATVLFDQFNLAERGVGLLKLLGGWPGVLSLELLEVMQKLLADRERLLAPLQTLPPTMIHGDAWQPNWLLCENRRFLLDWEDACLGPGLWDVMYFLEMSGESGGSVPISQEEAVQIYLNHLEAALGSSLGELRHTMIKAAPALAVLQVLTRWPLYACNYLVVIERYPFLVRLWQILPEAVRLYLARRMAWAEPSYYQGVFERFKQRTKEFYGV